MKKKTAPMLSGYPEFLGELKSRIRSARLAAARMVNRELILLYWDIGQAIVEKQAFYQWGDSVVETLAMDLRKAFPGTAGFPGATSGTCGGSMRSTLRRNFCNRLLQK